MTEAPTSATSTWISEPRQTLKRGQIDFRFVACTWRGSPSAKS